jgi:hypothetical protein
MEEAMGWLARYERFWREKLDALEAFLSSLRKRDAPAGNAGGAATKDVKNKT